MTKLSKKALDEKLENLIKLDKKAKALNKQVEKLKDELKALLNKTETKTLYGNKLYCYYKNIKREVVDNDKLKADNLYNKYLKTSLSHQFSYNVIK